MVEVKSERDHLSAQQRQWLRRLAEVNCRLGNSPFEVKIFRFAAKYFTDRYPGRSAPSKRDARFYNGGRRLGHTKADLLNLCTNCECSHKLES
jgi:hypothetical protein